MQAKPKTVGYNFPTLKDIVPFLEPTASGITASWARNAARKYGCFITAGYPEKSGDEEGEFYNSAITVNPEGETVAHYRKTFLYETDERWALEGSGFYSGEIPKLGKAAIGICE
jgi:protein N-terminal amidase